MSELKRILFMGGKPIGYHVCYFLLQTEHELRCIINDYETADAWYLSPRRLPIVEIGLDEIEAYNPDIVIVAFYDKILKEPLISAPPLGCWNLHLADAERYRGSYPNVHALRNGDTEYGVTIHRIDAGIDTGPILARFEFVIEPDWIGSDLYKWMVTAGHLLFVRCFDDLISGAALDIAVPQSGENAETHYRRELKHEISVPKYVKDAVRSLTFEPHPPPYFMIGNRKFVITEAKE